MTSELDEDVTSIDTNSLKPNLVLGPNCIICENSEIWGNVTIGSGTIIHPRAKIVAQSGSIIIGENNLIEEKTVLWNRQRNGESNQPMVIGNWNVFEVGTRCQSLKIGDNNLFEVRSAVGRNVIVGDCSTIGAGCIVVDNEVLPNNTGIYGDKCQRRKISGNPNPAPLLEHLRRILPNHNRIVKYKPNEK